MAISFYNSSGHPIAYSDDEVYIYLFDGQPVAYIEDESIFAYSGKHLGWFDSGWVRDHSGDCVFFTDKAIGGPNKPMKSIKPVKGVKGIRPIKGIKEIKPLKSIRRMGWSKPIRISVL